MVAPECAGAFTGGAGAGWEVEANSKEGGLVGWRWRGSVRIWLGFGLVLWENCRAGTVAEREEL